STPPPYTTLFPIHAGAHEVQALLAQRGLAAAGVAEQGVAGVDDDVALVHEAGQLVDDGVGGLAGLDHDDRHARLLQGGDEVRHGLRRVELALGGVVVHDRLGLADGAVVDGDLEAVAGEVAGEVRAHHRHTGDADVRDIGRGRSKAGHGFSSDRVTVEPGRTAAPKASAGIAGPTHRGPS